MFSEHLCISASPAGPSSPKTSQVLSTAFSLSFSDETSYFRAAHWGWGGGLELEALRPVLQR